MSKSNTQRNQAWLDDLLHSVWEGHFRDVKRVNNIRIEFGRRARRRLGSISVDREDSKVSVIRVNGWFREDEIPEFLVRSVIVHELCHYAHGFNSGSANRQHQYPHAGGVVRREFSERGLAELYDQQQSWLKQNWPRFISRRYPISPRRSSSRGRSSKSLLRRLIS